MLLGQLPDLRETQAGKELIAIGIEKGIEKGSLIGTIRTCQSVLGLEQSSETELLGKSMDDLATMAIKLQAAARSRFGTN